MGRVQRVKAPSKQKPEEDPESNSDVDSDAVEMAAEVKKPAASKGAKKKANGVEEKPKSTRGRKKADPEEEDVPEDVPEPPKASTRGRKKAAVPEEVPEPKKSSRKKKEAPKEEDPDEEPPKKMARGRKKAEAENGDEPEKPKARGRKKAETPEPSGSEPEKKASTRGRKKNPPKEESSENDEDEKKVGKKGKLDAVDEEVPEEVEEKLPAKRGRKPAVKAPVEDEDEEEEKPVVKRGRKPAEKKAKEPKASKGKKDEDLDEAEDPPAKKTKTEDKKQPMNKTETNLDEVDVTCDKTNAKGDTSNFKIVSWNVGGIRSIGNKKGVEYFLKEDADVIVMQETKCQEGSLPDSWELPGYTRFYKDSEKSGYAGVALFTKQEPIEVKKGLESAPCNEEGRIITAEFDKFYVINVYVPNAGAGLKNLEKRLEWNEAFKKYVKELDEKKPVIICGDMNVSHQEIDLANPKGNVKHAGFTKEEREGMDQLLGGGFVDTFRELYPDQTGAYTFWTYLNQARSKNVGWRLDYFIVSERVKENICDNVMRTNVFGSDHCPIVLYANF